MTSRSIRRAIAEDALALARIRNHAVAYKIRHGDLAWGKSGWTEAVALQILDRREMYVIEQDGIAAGMLSLSWQDEMYWGPQDPVAGYMHGLAVRHDFHGVGLGRFAVDWCADQVDTKDRRYLRLRCDGKNMKLCTYHESLGFSRVGVRPIPEFGGYAAALYEKRAR